MADIAAIFHWPLSELVKLDAEDLIVWRNRAVDRWNRMNGDKSE